ncbi:MAG: 1-deoxy-D-xylulose-5-phosphate reductoisomerase [Puniceicoccales bacterium]|jgi:1-deoxy-D-xylulose-5-phosphate reductoisomerase|nr:1-deoxy-D-xylulose-5-phosphate reductoisomerase [Puniceicoccales bacterium]
MVHNVIIFGATGSIGSSAISVIRRNRDRFRIVGLSARSNFTKLAHIAREFGVKKIAITDRQKFTSERAESMFPAGTVFLFGMEGNCELAVSDDGDAILMAISGTDGILPTMAAIGARKTIMLASKEILVAAGKFITAEAKRLGVQILPIDSEHNAIFQCLAGGEKFVKRVILTASGGPFRNYTPDQLKSVTIGDALKHPTWSMGAKITVDSATMVNKGLEMIEAKWLFDLVPKQISTIVHPESTVHSFVEFCDGSLLGQLAPHSMEYPIAHCLFYPFREKTGSPSLNLSEIGRLTFMEPNCELFPCLGLAKTCLNDGGNMASALLGADEVAVEAFLTEKITYLDIYRVISETLSSYTGEREQTLDSALKTISQARSIAQALL